MDKKGKHTHILVIRLSAMGDVAMLVPIFSLLQTKYPTLKITLLTRAHFGPIFSELPNVDVFPALVKSEHKGFFGLFRLFRALKSLEIDAVADTHNVLRSNVLKLFFKLSGIPVVQLDKGRLEKKALTRAKNKKFKPLKPTHERYADVFKELGFTVDFKAWHALTKQSVPKKAITMLQHSFEKWIGIAPFAAHEGKMYPLKSMEAVIQLVLENNCTVLLFGGGKKEELLLNGLSQKLGPKVISVAGKLNFNEELALISNLDLMLSMDSGNGHLAANYGVPVITIWGVTHPYAGFAPFGQPISRSLIPDRTAYPLLPTSIYGNKFPEGYEHAIATTTPQQVFEKIQEVY
ncbi:MAG: glycosyltransferase family 9 protein [Bacteroidota bacterium]